MSMKGKPNTAQFKPPKTRPPSLKAGGRQGRKAAGGTCGRAPPAATPPAVEETQRYGRARVQKIFNFPEELADRLRAKRSSDPREGRRVTEKDIVIEALEAFLKG
jgi:hypothetical protein